MTKMTKNEEVVDLEEAKVEELEEVVDLEEAKPEKADAATGIIAWCDKHRKGVNRFVKGAKITGIVVGSVVTLGGAAIAVNAAKKAKAGKVTLLEDGEIEGWESTESDSELTPSEIEILDDISSES